MLRHLMLLSGRPPFGARHFAPVHVAPLHSYIPMEKGHAYLVAIMDWHSRSVLAWEISNPMETAFCVRALKEALRRTGLKPRIFNTDQGSQFTGKEWISELQKQGMQISMDGKGRRMNNVFIERL